MIIYINVMVPYINVMVTYINVMVLGKYKIDKDKDMQEKRSVLGVPRANYCWKKGGRALCHYTLSATLIASH